VKNKKSILILVRDNASSTKTWSGIPFHIIRILKDYGHNVEVFDNLGFPRSPLWRFRRLVGKISSVFAPKYYSEISSSYYGKKINQFLKSSKKNYDFILAIDFLEGILDVKTEIPILVYRDASYALLNKLSYPGFESFDEEGKKILFSLEKKCLRKVSKMLFTSSWAINETLDFYPELQKEKFFVQPFSSQLYPPPTNDDWEIRDISKADVIKFLFVGRDWDRKGGEDSVKILQQLTKKMKKVHLTIVGHKPETKNFGFSCEVIENLDVSVKSDFELLKSLYKNSHFFILPTKIEAFGIVFSEAMSLGLPVITRNVCAIPEILSDGKEGFLIQDSESLDIITDKISEFIEDPEKYKQMQENASRRFLEHFHPKLWVKRLIEISEKNL